MKRKIKNALISLSDKSELNFLLKCLRKHNINIISSGGTFKKIKKLGYKSKEVSDFTKFDEILGGRVKTLHPIIHAGILAKSQKDLDELISESEKKVSESTSLYEYTRLINDLCDYQDKLKLINNLWAIAFADKYLDKYEEHLIRKVSDLLYISHSDFIQQKLKVKESLL